MFSMITRNTECGTPDCNCGEPGPKYVAPPEGDAPPDAEGGAKFVGVPLTDC